MPTAQMYEQLFEKPKMTEKLLTKPPFRYLHDIFLATIGATGFANGLYTDEEMDSKANHEKDAKISILTKMITLTEMMIGEKMDVKPSKIVAGMEPERKNYFLQQLFRAATSGMDSEPYVRKIMGGGGDDDEEQAAAEEAARQHAEELARQAAEEEKAKKKAADQKKKAAAGNEEKKKQEEMARRRQEEEEDRKRQEAEAARQRQAEEQKARAK